MQREQIIEDIFASHKELRRAIKSYFSQKLSGDVVTSSHVMALILLKETTCIKGKDLANRMQISPSAASQLVDSLDELGYIKREIDERDRRITYLCLSKKGERMVARIAQQRTDFFKESTACLTDSELASLLTLQRKLLASVQKMHTNNTKQ